MMSSYAKMGVEHDKFLPLAPACAKSRLCTSTWQTMVIASRSDVDMLNCDQAPALEPQKAAAARAFAACYKLRRDAQFSPSSLQQDTAELILEVDRTFVPALLPASTSNAGSTGSSSSGATGTSSANAQGPAIEKRDADQLCAALQAHIYRAKDTLVATLRQLEDTRARQ